MPNKAHRLFLLGLLALPLAACGQSTDTGSASTPAPAASPATVISVVSDPTTIGTYTPPMAHVKVGETVQWTFVDKNPHSVTADDSSFDSTPMANGKTFSHRFATAGTYAYHCSIHPEMHGTVVAE